MREVPAPFHRGARMAVWSHRGRLTADVSEPENTLAAFAHASGAGVDGIELDTWLTADGVFVVRHDRDVAAGPIDALGRDELPDDVPDLADALGACAVATVDVELKVAPEASDADADRLGVALARALLDEQAELVRAGRLVVSSFSRAALDAVRRTADAAPTAARAGGTAGAAGQVGSGRALATGYLVGEVPSADACAGIARSGHGALNVAHRNLDADGVARCRAAGLAVVAWTADAPDDVRRLDGLGVDVLISNEPVAALRLRPA